MIFLLKCTVTADAAEPLLVVQPSYAGMQFYVSQPQGLPPQWYTTFDGYPVWKNADGIWLYGSFSGSELIPTNYIVGSVIPSIAGLAPYVVQTAPQNMVVQAVPVISAQEAVVAPAMSVPAYTVPEWRLNPHFAALGEWRGNVDRIGILHKPAVPIAWKGRLPKVIYAWTGTTWYQMVVREGERPGDVLRNNLYLLARLVNKNGAPAWVGPDALFLAHLSAQWGYVWMGEITPTLPPSYY
ncbi:MAG: hypothetical protein LBJ22_02365 [Synergistaceae bacterium]|nr:hypothetical protein [Synergistaceae bacterium]